MLTSRPEHRFKTLSLNSLDVLEVDLFGPPGSDLPPGSALPPDFRYHFETVRVLVHNDNGYVTVKSLALELLTEVITQNNRTLALLRHGSSESSLSFLCDRRSAQHKCAHEDWDALHYACNECDKIEMKATSHQRGTPNSHTTSRRGGSPRSNASSKCLEAAHE